MTAWAGVDVGAGRLHAVRLEAAPGDRPAVAGRLVTAAPAGLDELAGFCSGAARVAVDAPAAPSVGAHLDDTSIAPKFRSGRCSEVPVKGVPAVSWVTPLAGLPVPGWMLTGFAVWAALTAAGLEAVEAFPAAAWFLLNASAWPPPKSTAAGRRARHDLLVPRVGLPPGAAGWGHDDLDATVAALVAATGHPLAHVCASPDGSALWVPAV